MQLYVYVDYLQFIYLSQDSHSTKFVSLSQRRYICCMSRNILPFELLEEVVTVLGCQNKPLQYRGEEYRPLVFQSKDNGMYICAFILASLNPAAAFNVVNEQYDQYLDGVDTDTIFLRAEDPDDLISIVIDWYNNEQQQPNFN